MYRKFNTSKRYFGFVFPAITAAGLLLSPLASYAKNIDWYGGASTGTSHYEVTGPTGFTGTINGNDNAWKVFLGMQLWDKYVAAETGYIRFGEAAGKGTYLGDSVSSTQETKAYFAAAKGLIPLSTNLGFTIKLGVAGMWANIESTGSATTAQLQPNYRSQSMSDLKMFGGVGFQYDISKKISARFEAERFNLGSIGAASVSTFTWGLTYRLGK